MTTSQQRVNSCTIGATCHRPRVDERRRIFTATSNIAPTRVHAISHAPGHAIIGLSRGLFRRRSESFASHGGYRAALTTPTLLDSEISHTCIKWKALELDIVQAKYLFDCCGFAPAKFR
jgi:hypothetical protein